MLLFGNEFDADERAEVCGGDGFGEGKLADVARNFGSDVDGVAEKQRVDVAPVGGKKAGHFIGGHLVWT